MKSFLTILLLPFVGCTALDIDRTRIGAGAFNIDATARGESGGERIESTGSGSGSHAIVELTNDIDEDTSVGFYGKFAQAAIEDVDNDQFGAGAAIRRYLTGGPVRPYIEGRAGYNRFQVRDDILGDGNADALELGAGVGVELGSFFVQADFGALFADQFEADGLGFTVGGVITW